MFSEETYSDFVAVRVKGGEDILAGLDHGKCDLLHMAIGISGEAGELLDAVKKHVIYGKPLDRENVIEELGDLEFYLAGIRNTLALPREFIIESNVAKLQKRYPISYSDAHAIARADKPSGQ